MRVCTGGLIFQGGSKLNSRLLLVRTPGQYFFGGGGGSTPYRNISVVDARSLRPCMRPEALRAAWAETPTSIRAGAMTVVSEPDSRCAEGESGQLPISFP